MFPCGSIHWFKFSSYFSDEVRYERTFFSCISAHKDVMRSLSQGGKGGLLVYKTKIKSLLDAIYEQHCYLWDENMDTIINEFVASSPLIAEIRDRFVLFDNRTNNLNELEKSERIESIKINLNEFLNECIVYSKAWKTTMGKYLTTMYKKKLLVFVDFISDMDSILKKQLKDLDDVRIAMNALERIREESVT